MLMLTRVNIYSSRYHMPVDVLSHPSIYRMGHYAKSIGFSHVASGPLVRSSYHADQQAKGDLTINFEIQLKE